VTIPNEFQYDVLLSHSVKAKAVVRSLAERLGKDRPGLQPSAFIFQPFLGAPIKGSWAQLRYLNWHQADREQDYAKPFGTACERLKPR
jgi:hypothetical protein